MSSKVSTHVVIIGGGASGVLMATHLLNEGGPQVRVTILEGRHMLGCGVAYSTRDPNHLLNTRVHNMSAFPQDPHHFHHWLTAQPGYDAISDASFVSRETYGRYMADLLRPWQQAQDPRLTCRRDICVGLSQRAGGVVLQLASGEQMTADRAILATGHVMPPSDPENLLSGSWDWQEGLDPKARVLIIGSGLSMVDQVLSLLKQGHHGEIVAVSRRGLLPRGHAPVTPLKITPEDVPFGAPVSRLLAWARGLARQAEASGGTWRDAVDGIRPYVRGIWQRLPILERRRFMRHAATWWDVHRHRIPPQSADALQAAFASGQLRQIKAAYMGADRDVAGCLTVRLRAKEGVQAIPVAVAVDCRGILRDPVRNASPLTKSLLDQGLARVDPLGIGLDVSPDCGLRDHQGQGSRQILAIGPVSRAAFWEITAIPDIREQTRNLAQRLAQEASLRKEPLKS